MPRAHAETPREALAPLGRADLEGRAHVAKRAAAAFVRGFGIHRYYTAGSHLGVQRAVDELLHAIDRFVGPFGPLTLTIHDTELRWHGQVLHTHGERRGSVAFRLFREGLRELTFTRGITRTELVTLIELLRAVVDEVGLSADDLISGLWQRDIPHIHYRAVEPIPLEARIRLDAAAEAEADQIEAALRGESTETYRLFALPEELPDLEEAVFSEDLGPRGSHCLAAPFLEIDDPILTHSGSPPDQPGAHRALSGPEQASRLRDVPIEDDPGRWGERLLPVVRATAEEERSIRNEAGVYTPAVLFSMVGEVIFESLSLAPQLVHDVDLVQFFTHLVDAHMAAGSFAGSCHALEQIRARVGQGGGIPRRVYDEIILELGAWEHMEVTLRRVSRALENGPAPVLRYLQMLPPRALGHVVEMLPEIPKGALREVLLRALSERLATSQEILGALVMSADEELVDCALAHFAEHDDPSHEVYYLRTIQHPSPQVRVRTLQAMQRADGLRPIQLARDSLTDGADAVRIAAARLLARTHDPLASDSLETRIRSRDFHGLGNEEKTALFHALATSGRERALPFLEELMLRRKLFPNDLDREMRRLAAHALGDLDHPRARALLERGSKARDPALRGICKRALARQASRT